MVKYEYFDFGDEEWQYKFEKMPDMSNCVRIEVRLIPPYRKWYQTRFLHRDFSYAIGIDEIDPANLRARAYSLVDRYYKEITANEKLDEFLAAELY